MMLAMDYFEETEDVSSENYGWDINSYSNNQLFQIEVKGISANRVHFELTPNEYDALQAHKETYVLFVVTGALTKAAKCHIFRYSSSTKWISDQGDKLTFKSRTGAVAKVAP
nr:DUF3883 domain-containing protein [Thalassospira sp. HF15]